VKPVFLFSGDPGACAFVSTLLASHPECVRTPQFTAAYTRAARGTLFDFGLEAPLLGSPLKAPAQDASTFPAFIARLVSAYASDHGRSEAEVWLEVVTLDQLPLLSETFPEASFLHLVRDGRAVAASHWQIPGEHQTMAQASRAWNDSVNRGLAAEARLGDERCLRIGYELLLSDLAGGLEVLAEIIGVSPGGFRIPAPSLSRDYTSHLYGWRTRLPKHEVKRFKATSGTLLTDLGYGLESGASGLPSRPDVWAKAGHQRMKTLRDAPPGQRRVPSKPEAGEPKTVRGRRP